jgi:carbon monoxide dehydrogenase subunit G
MIRFENDRDFRFPLEEVFARLTDVPFLVQCLPDVESVRDVGPTEATVVVRPGLGFLRGKLDARIQVVEKEQPKHARWTVSSRGIGSSAEVDVRMNFLGQPEGARVHWVAEITSLGGLLKMVPSGLIRGAAEKVISDIWSAVEARLSSTTPSG